MTTMKPTTWTVKNKIGLALAIVMSVANLPSALFPTTEGETGPPLAILVVCSILGVVGVAAGIIAWVRASRPAARVAVVSVVVPTVTALPAFFVDVPAGIKVLAAAMVLLTVTVVVLVFSPARTAD